LPKLLFFCLVILYGLYGLYGFFKRADYHPPLRRW